MQALMAHMTLYPEAMPGRPLFVVRDGSGQPLVFVIDAAGRLLLLRAGAWKAIGLPGPVTRADIRQAVDGTLSVALALVDGTILVATGVASTRTDGWPESLAPCSGLPADAQVTRLAFGPLQEGAPPLLLVGATAEGATATWYGNAATPAQGLRPLRLPDGACAVGSYRLPGAWTLREGALRFTSFDTAGWKVDVAYPHLPAATASVLLAAGSMPNVPDVFAAGASIVVYRGNNPVPQRVADVAGARLVWNARSEAGEYLIYADGDDALWLVSRPAGGAWRTPAPLTPQRAVPMLADDGILHMATLHGDTLTLSRHDVHGALLEQTAISLPTNENGAATI
ncbi:hypothetical protein GCM10007388_32790 [Pseudoduganella plicata]|nr:hypothetical protein GCM10007388_32790 [Pseudoduganella plicata]